MATLGELISRYKKLGPVMDNVPVPAGVEKDDEIDAIVNVKAPAGTPADPPRDVKFEDTDLQLHVRRTIGAFLKKSIDDSNNVYKPTSKWTATGGGINQMTSMQDPNGNPVDVVTAGSGRSEWEHFDTGDDTGLDLYSDSGQLDMKMASPVLEALLGKNDPSINLNELLKKHSNVRVSMGKSSRGSNRPA